LYDCYVPISLYASQSAVGRLGPFAVGTVSHQRVTTFPDLAAQTAPYLEAQLRAFRDQTRRDPDALSYMWGMAAQLSDAGACDQTNSTTIVKPFSATKFGSTVTPNLTTWAKLPRTEAVRRPPAICQR
jgi:hypothetical protein